MADTLQNKFNSTDSDELARLEEKLSKKRALELFDFDLLRPEEAGTVRSLAFIHQYMFQDIYDFAGKIRTVNLAKGNMLFAPALFLESSLIRVEKMPQQTFEEIVAKYVEMNVAHPFREGNGRSMRIWLDQMLKLELDCVIDWTKLDKDEYLHAMALSPINDVSIRNMLREAITDLVEDTNVYIDGIDASFSFEDLTSVKTAEL